MATAEETDELLGSNPFHDYNAEERRYSVHVRETLMRLLKGDLDVLDLMIKYHIDPRRLGAVLVPKTIDASALRLPQVEQLLASAIRFLHDGSEGGPIIQEEGPRDGIVLQKRDFPTRFPHIVIERTDKYDQQNGILLESYWCAHRIQNQSRSIQVNRVLDAMNLGLALLHWRG